MMRKNKGFTLVEIVVTLTILAIVIGVSVGGIYMYVGQSKINTDKANLKSMQDAFSGLEEDNDFFFIVADSDEDNMRWDLVWDGNTSDEMRNVENIRFHKAGTSTSLLNNKQSGLENVSIIKTSDSDTSEASAYIDKYASNLFTDGLPKSQSGATFMLTVEVTNNDEDDIGVSTKGYLLDLNSSKVYYPEGTSFSEAITSSNEAYAKDPNAFVGELTSSSKVSPTQGELETIDNSDIDENKDENDVKNFTKEEIDKKILDELQEFLNAIITDEPVHNNHKNNDIYATFNSNSYAYFDADKNEISGWLDDGTPVVDLWWSEKSWFWDKLDKFKESGDISEEDYNKYYSIVDNANYIKGSIISTDATDDSGIYDLSLSDFLAEVQHYIDVGRTSLYDGVHQWDEKVDKDKYSLQIDYATFLDDNKREICCWDNEDGTPYIGFGMYGEENDIGNITKNRLKDEFDNDKISKKKYNKLSNALKEICCVPTTADTPIEDIETTDEEALDVLNFLNACKESYNCVTYNNSTKNKCITSTYVDGKNYYYAEVKDGKYYTNRGDEIIGWVKSGVSFNGSYTAYVGRPAINFERYVGIVDDLIEQEKLSFTDAYNCKKVLKKLSNYNYDAVIIKMNLLQ